MSWLGIVFLLAQEAEDTTGELKPGGELEEEVVEKGEYEITDMRKPLLELPFDPVEEILVALKSYNAPQKVLEAAQRVRDAVQRLDTSGVYSAAEVRVRDKAWRGVDALLVGAAELKFGRYGMAAEDLREFAERARGGPMGREARALAVLGLLYAGRYEEAQLLGSSYINEAAEDVAYERWNGWLHWATGEAAYYNKNYILAERFYVDNIERKPDHQVELWSRLGAGWCNLHQGRYADAKGQFDVVLLGAEGELAKSAELGRAIAVFNLGNYQEAMRVLDELAVPLPKNPELAAEILYYRGYVADVLRDFAKAEGSWLKVVSDYANLPRAADAAMKLGESYAASGKNKEAISILSWLIEKFPNYSKVGRAIYMVAEMYFAEKEYRKALQYFKEYLKRFPNSTLADEVKARMQQTYFAIAVEDESIIPEFERAFPNSPDLAEALFYWGSKHYDQGDTAQAAEYFYKMATLFPKHRKAPEALFYAGQIYYSMKKWGYAASTLRKYLDLYPNAEHKGEAIKLVGISYVMMEKYQEAVKFLKKLLAESKDLADQAVAHHYLGLAYMKMGKAREAAQHLDEASLAYTDLGRFEEAEIVNKLKEQLPMAGEEY